MYLMIIESYILSFLHIIIYCGCSFELPHTGISNKQIQRIYVPRQYLFLRNKESSENVKFIGEATLTRYILSTYVDNNNA